ERPVGAAQQLPAAGRPAPRLGLPLAGPRRRRLGGAGAGAERGRLRRPAVGRLGRPRHGPRLRRRGRLPLRPAARLPAGAAARPVVGWLRAAASSRCRPLPRWEGVTSDCPAAVAPSRPGRQAGAAVVPESPSALPAVLLPDAPPEVRPPARV